ncbi:MAG TPA: prephenate dehydratase [Bryobacteraceae bacterium]|nr:prephenate dehydratase [Bryobacteraceae bacterium]
MANNRENRVAFQGELGAFSHLAAIKLAGTRVSLLPCESFKQVFERLRKGEADKAVIPIENTLHGSVHENYDYLLQFDAPITGETTLRISHNLVALPEVKRAQIVRAFSHPVALNQCRRFFAEHPRIEPVAFYDTAGSVKMLKEERPAGTAAIASEMAAELYGAQIIERNIEDNPHNFTRFFLLTKQTPPRKGRTTGWKTSIVFSTANTPGALFRAMACFALRDLNLTKIESRPLPERPWEYLFYLDFFGAQTDEKVKRALDHLQEMATFFKVMGSYRPTP